MDILEELSAARRADWESAARVRDFASALKGDTIRIIAEVKKASPSEGVIRESFDPVAHARDYEKSGAAALSVLCEPHRFLGSDHFLEEIRREVDVPLLYKDFITTEFQILRARACGADACLLIAAVLDDAKLKRLLETARSLGLEALVETHTEEEIRRAAQVGATIIGVNCRDLRTFKTDPSLTARLVEKIPDGIVKVGESGIKTPEDVRTVRSAGADAVLIGTTFMRAENPGEKLKEFL